MRILICDDEPLYLEELYTKVKDYMDSRFIECEIVKSMDAKKAVEDEGSFDLAFLDIQMEGMDGIALARELKTQRQAGPVLYHKL